MQLKWWHCPWFFMAEKELKNKENMTSAKANLFDWQVISCLQTDIIIAVNEMLK